MLRQLNLAPLLVIPIATLVFVARAEIVHINWLSPIEREILPPIIEHLPMTFAQTGKAYDVYVQLPGDYAGSGASYPVIYSVFEAPYLIGYKNIITPLLRRSRIPDVIAVSVSPAKWGAGGRAEGLLRGDPMRWSDDMTRAQHTYKGSPPVGGKAEAFTAFVEQDLIPAIDAKYRTVKDDRCLAGFDISAVFVVETALARPELFQKYLAIAPIASWGEHATIRFAKERVTAEYDPPIRLYLGIGSLDQDSNLESYAQLTQVLASKRYELLKFESEILPTYQHISVVAPAAKAGLRFLYGNQ